MDPSHLHSLLNAHHHPLSALTSRQISGHDILKHPNSW